MAITSRAARQTNSNGVYNTPDVVGPGSYLRVERDPTIHGFAPFSSTVERPGPTAMPGATPGPGAYVTPLENTIGRTPFAPNGVPPGAGAAFANRVPRMPKPEIQKRTVPGPGRYTLRDEWQTMGQVAALHNEQPPQKRAPQAGALGPPSIPAPEQSFGYEETREGELRMQRPPQGGYTGVSGHRSAGPGEYEPTRASGITKRAGVMPSFGNSRVVRAVFSENKEVPGPGAYQPHDAPGRVRPGAAFLSRVPLSHQKLLDPEKLVPGPGAYAAMPGITPKAVPENLQAFGSTQKRLASDAVTPNERQRMAQPGPGAYEERRTDFHGRSKMGAGAPAAASAAVPAGDKGQSGFNSSTVRFTALSKSGKPGPGAYDELDQHSFIANMGKRTHGRHGVFGSTTRRFHSLKQDAVPGAGTYNPATASGGGEERDEGPSSSFASGVQRFTKSAPTRVTTKVGKQKDTVPPPWQYNPASVNQWGASGKQNAKPNENFGSTVERFPIGELGGGQRIKQVPGPGQYMPKHPEEGFRKQQTTVMSFGTKEERFAMAQKGTFTGGVMTPGPGQYEASVELSDPLVKRSFNITIG